mmetsp:Transcript_2569/g.9628  ORF Transcript_2569/g.9628 Transcript_2569/m.9628 type:complete len:230 (+) Transcript_2569:1663-2352(+)
MCASTSSIMESIMSICSSISSRPSRRIGDRIDPCLAEDPPDSPRSHAAACRTSSCSMVFSMSSSSNMPPAPFSFPSSSSSSTSVSSSSERSPSGAMSCHLISTSTSRRCLTAPRSSPSRKGRPAGVSTKANAARRYWHCRALTAVLCGSLRSKMPPSTVADRGTRVRIWVMAPTIMAVVSAADRGGGPFPDSSSSTSSPSPRDASARLVAGDCPVLMYASSSSSNRPSG